MIEPPEPNPERDRLEELLQHATKRRGRAIEKHQIAERELRDATDSVFAASAALGAWLAANPDPQRSLPMEEPCLTA